MHPCPDTHTLTQLLALRAKEQPNQIAFRFLPTGEGPSLDLTYLELHDRSVSVARWLMEQGAPGDRVLLQFHEGLDYLIALFGCMFAGQLAVPVHPPDHNRLARTLPRLQNVASDAKVSVVLGERMVIDQRADLIKDCQVLGEAIWKDLQTIPHSEQPVEFPECTPQTLAYLQYTSGSTALPKGVMINHHNLMHQLTDFNMGYEHDHQSVMVSWLPATHDLGLVYGRFMPLFVGFPCVFFSPARFMQRPGRWMAAVHKYRGTHSPAPNFGYDVAAAKTPPEVLATLDLSCLKVLLNGAEPIRQESERRFLRTFLPCKLPPSAITHAMGMSEATAKIVTEPIDRYPAKFLYVDPEAYERKQVRVVPESAPNRIAVASNGSTLLDTRVIMVDPATKENLGDLRVGEMWVSGTTVAQGYYNNKTATEEGFRAFTADGEGPFLRTGDLGFLFEGEMYLSGRLKELIILRGQNHHPADLEWAMSTSHPCLRTNCAAAFSIQGETGEELVVVTEVYPTKYEDPEEVFAAIRGALSEVGVSARSLILMPPRTLPKTSSGKIQRSAAKAMFADGELPTLFRWNSHTVAEQLRPTPSASNLVAKLEGKSAADQAELLVEVLCTAAAGLLGVDSDDIEPDQPLKELGIDSITAVEMVEQVAGALALDLPGTILFDYPTIEGLAEYLVEEVSRKQPKKAEITKSSVKSTSVETLSEEEALRALNAELDDL